MQTNTDIQVWDRFVRFFHWTLVVCFFSAYLTEGDLLPAHVWAGYIAFSLLCLRLVWGFTGTRHARFADFVHGPGKVLRYTQDVLARRAPRYIGHNPAGGAMIVALIVGVLTNTLTGMALYGADAWLGPLAWLMADTSKAGIKRLKDIHEIAAHLTVALVAIHVAGVIWESVLHRENLVKSMLTGRKRA
jgi:cytochrome b